MKHLVKSTFAVGLLLLATTVSSLASHSRSIAPRPVVPVATIGVYEGIVNSRLGFTKVNLTLSPKGYVSGNLNNYRSGRDGGQYGGEGQYASFYGYMNSKGQLSSDFRFNGQNYTLELTLSPQSKSVIGTIKANRTAIGTMFARLATPNYAPATLNGVSSNAIYVYGYRAYVSQFLASTLDTNSTYRPDGEASQDISGNSYSYVKVGPNKARLTIGDHSFTLIFYDNYNGFILTPQGPTGMFYIND